jgi:6-phosphogluconolactonase/glucosamine-6-phosphate isomerase/deaminase
MYGPKDPQRLPIQVIQPTSGQLIWMLDQAAAAQLKAAT